MGKITTLYLTDEEPSALKEFCAENQCTQYSALKTALKELLSRSVGKTAKRVESTQEVSYLAQDPEASKAIRKSASAGKRRVQSLRDLLECLHTK